MKYNNNYYVYWWLLVRELQLSYYNIILYFSKLKTNYTNIALMHLFPPIHPHLMFVFASCAFYAKKYYKMIFFVKK